MGVQYASKQFRGRIRDIAESRTMPKGVPADIVIGVQGIVRRSGQLCEFHPAQYHRGIPIDENLGAVQMPG